MTCAVCGAPVERSRTHCAICGFAKTDGAAKRWDREPESNAYEDMTHALEPDESLLGVTRGKIAGTWKRPLSFQPQALLSPYVNLGITDDKLILQPVHSSNGRAVSDKGSTIPLKDVSGITLSDADPMEAGRTTRLVIQVNSGEGFRLRSSGRFAESACNLVEVWQSLTGKTPRSHNPDSECGHCGRELDKPYKFCPFCGLETQTSGD